MFLIPIWGVKARDSTPCLNEWVHVEIVKIGLRGKAMQTGLVSLLDVEGCSFRCGCSQQLASVGLTLCRLRWITLQTNSLQEELEDAGRALCYILYPNSSWSHLYMYTIVPEHDCIPFWADMPKVRSAITMLVEETLSKSKRKRKQTQMKRLCSLGRISWIHLIGGSKVV